MDIIDKIPGIIGYATVSAADGKVEDLTKTNFSVLRSNGTISLWI